MIFRSPEDDEAGPSEATELYYFEVLEGEEEQEQEEEEEAEQEQEQEQEQAEGEEAAQASGARSGWSFPPEETHEEHPAWEESGTPPPAASPPSPGATAARRGRSTTTRTGVLDELQSLRQRSVAAQWCSA